jgi:hypothetical protein
MFVAAVEKYMRRLLPSLTPRVYRIAYVDRIEHMSV